MGEPEPVREDEQNNDRLPDLDDEKKEEGEDEESEEEDSEGTDKTKPELEDGEFLSAFLKRALQTIMDKPKTEEGLKESYNNDEEVNQPKEYVNGERSVEEGGMFNVEEAKKLLKRTPEPDLFRIENDVREATVEEKEDKSQTDYSEDTHLSVKGIDEEDEEDEEVENTEDEEDDEEEGDDWDLCLLEDLYQDEENPIILKDELITDRAKIEADMLEILDGKDGEPDKNAFQALDFNILSGGLKIGDERWKAMMEQIMYTSPYEKHVPREPDKPPHEAVWDLIEREDFNEGRYVDEDEFDPNEKLSLDQIDFEELKKIAKLVEEGKPVPYDNYGY